MKTLTLQEPGRFSLQDTPPPSHALKNQALVRVHRVGICGTDLHAFQGKQPFFAYPRIIGHELAVEIVELGETDEAHDVAVGDWCAVEPYLNCGQCRACQRGYTNACSALKVLGVHIDGGMRELLNLPIRKLHRVRGLSLAQIALVETMGIGAHAVRRARLEAGEFVLVIGAGAIGMGTMQFAKLANAKVIAMDVNPDRLHFCQNVLGIPYTIDARHNSLDQLREILGEDRPSAVFDATGNLTSMTNAFQYVAHAGRLIFVGLAQGDITFNDPYFHSHEITLLASRNATRDDFSWVIEALEKHTVSVDRWVTHETNPEELPTDFPNWLHPQSGLLKAMLRFT
ncbi:MAG: zinc-binding alcohol dehydrogenase family protein [Chloroflexi bacterium]|nr:zinc-binding alcohol dehydrogenase family protein [Chloroflexota bacterium]